MLSPKPTKTSLYCSTQQCTRNSYKICYKTNIKTRNRSTKGENTTQQWFAAFHNILTHGFLVRTCLWSLVWSAATFQTTTKTLLQHGIALGARMLTLQVSWQVLFGVECFSGSLSIWLQLYLLCYLAEGQSWSTVGPPCAGVRPLRKPQIFCKIFCFVVVRKKGIISSQWNQI